MRKQVLLSFLTKTRKMGTRIMFFCDSKAARGVAGAENKDATNVEKNWEPGCFLRQTGNDCAGF